MRPLALALFLTLSAACLSAFSADTPDQAKAAGLVPHKALYDIRLTNTKSGSQIVNIHGKMLYEWNTSCDAWTTDQRFNLSYEYADSPAMNITSDFSTYETIDGKSMNFTSQKKQDGNIFEEIRGQATRDEKGAGEVIFTLPKDVEFNLSASTLFPMGHTLELMNAIKAGKKFYSATTFDGSDDKGPVEVNAFIGKPVETPVDPKTQPDIDAALMASPAHQIRLAFFPPEAATEGGAEYEMSAVFHENGVISDMLVDYKDFSVKQSLVALETQDPTETTCAGPHKKTPDNP